MQLKCVQSADIYVEPTPGIISDLTGILSTVAPTDGSSESEYRAIDPIGEIYIDSGAPFSYPFSFSDSGIPQQPLVGQVFSASNGLALVSSFLSTFPANGSLIDLSIPTIYYAQYDEVLDDIYYEPVDNAFNVRLRYTYKENAMAQEFFASIPTLKVSRYVKNGDNADFYEYLVSASSQVLISSIPNVSAWESVIATNGLDDNATGFVGVTDRPYFTLIAEWNVPLEPYTDGFEPPAMNAGFTEIGLTFDLLFGDYFGIQEVTTQTPNSFGFNFPPDNSTEFTNWSVPPFETRIPFQNYSAAVPNFYLKGKK